MSDVVRETWDALRAAGAWLTLDELTARAGSLQGLEPAVVRARVDRAALGLVREALIADPSHNGAYPDKTGIAWLDKLLAAARVRELSQVKIVKAQRSGSLRYDIGELNRTFHGRRICESVGLSKRRSVADRDEYAAIQAVCARIKLKLPEAVEPTTTERFFEETP
jgi:hypothetical protein